MGSSQATWQDMERGYPHCIRHCNAHPMCEGCSRYETSSVAREANAGIQREIRRQAGEAGGESIGSSERGEG